MKKLGKLSLKRLEDEMLVMDEMMLKRIMGGYDPNDCMWRCFAYIDSGGSNFTASDAENLAAQFYGSGFNSSNYGFVGTESQAEQLASNVLCGNYVQNSRQIMVFDPSQISGWEGNGNASHAVIVTGFDDNTGEWLVFDPQNNAHGRVKESELNSSTGKYFM